LNSETLKRDVKDRKFGALEDLLNWLEDLYNSDDSDVLIDDSDIESVVGLKSVHDKLKSGKLLTTKTVSQPTNEYTSSLVP